MSWQGARGAERRIGQASTYPIRRKPMSSSRRTTTITRQGAGMTQGKTVTIVLVALIVGLGAGFVLRPIILPPGPATAGVTAPLPAMTQPRGTQYLRAQLDDAPDIAEKCKLATVPGNGCATSTQA